MTQQGHAEEKDFRIDALRFGKRLSAARISSKGGDCILDFRFNCLTTRRGDKCKLAICDKSTGGRLLKVLNFLHSEVNPDWSKLSIDGTQQANLSNFFAQMGKYIHMGDTVTGMAQEWQK